MNTSFSRPRIAAIAILASILVPRAVGQETTAPKHPIPKLSPAITRAEIEAHVRFLAADERKGRFTGSPEAVVCAHYLAEVFAAQGLAPAGDDGTFLQKVPLHRTAATAMPELAFGGAQGEPQALVFGRDFDIRRTPRAGKDLKLVVAKSAADLPKAADPKVALFIDGTNNERRKWLEAAGLGEGRGFGLVLVPGGSKPGQPRAFESLSNVSRAAGEQTERAATISVHGTALERLRSGAVRTIDVDPHMVSETIAGHNVVARLAGAGKDGAKDMAEETIVVTAHYDHLDASHGHGPPGAKEATGKKDEIWNGADDDASGVAAVLEIAGAMAAEKAPARSVVFLLVTGEEIGLIGTEVYLDNPVAPLAKTIANVNFEMIGRPDAKVGGAGKLWLTGFELTNLGPAWKAAKLAIEPDPYPEQNFYQRSDNIAFVNRGIVGQTLSTYNLHKDYHQPSDEADTLDYAHMEGCTRAGLAAVQMIASGALTPAFVEGKSKRPKR